MTNELTTVQESLVTKPEPLFGKCLPADILAKRWLTVILGQAQAQIEAETTDDSPWSVREGDDDATQARKEKRQHFEIANRALEIAQRTESIMGVVVIQVIDTIKRYRLNWFTDDGHQDLETLVRETLPDPEDSSTYRGQVSFVENAMPAMRDAGVPEEEIAKVVARGATIVTSVGRAVSKAVKDGGHDTRKRIKEIAVDAQTESRRNFDARWNRVNTYSVPYDVTPIDGGHQLLSFLVDDTHFQTVFGRLSDIAVESSEPLALQIANKQIRSLELAGDMEKHTWTVLTKTERVVLGIIQANEGGADVSGIMTLTEQPKRAIKKAIRSLAEAGLIVSSKVGNIELWQKVGS